MRPSTARLLRVLARAAPNTPLAALDAFAADWGKEPALTRAALWTSLVEAEAATAAERPAAKKNTLRKQTLKPERSSAYAAVERERKRLLMRAADFMPLWLQALSEDAGPAFGPAPAAARRSLAKLVAHYEAALGAHAVAAAAKAVSRARSFAYDVA